MKKKTHDKYHRFVKFVLAPISSICNVFLLYQSFIELFDLALPFRSNRIRFLLSTTGHSLTQLGPYFWVVLFVLGFQIINTILLIYASVGLNRKKKYGIFAWLMHCIALSVFLYYVNYFKTLHSDAFVLMSKEYLRIVNAISIGNLSMILQNILLFVLVLCIGFTVLNFMYYRKRLKEFTR